MDIKYLNFICTKDTFSGAFDESVVPFDAYKNYEQITAFYDSCPECQSFPKEEYFDGGWYDKWEDYVIWADGKIAARAGIWKCNEDEWEVAGVITHPEYRRRGLSARVVSHCVAIIHSRGKNAFLSTAVNNYSMICAAKKAGFVLRRQEDQQV